MEKARRGRSKGDADNPEVIDLINLGPACSEWLRAVGITTRRELEEAGAVEVYIRVALHGFRPTMNLLYALDGALRGIRWDKLPKHIKQELKLEAQRRMGFERI